MIEEKAPTETCEQVEQCDSHEAADRMRAAYEIGRTGAPHSDEERALFLEYLRGRCWEDGCWNEARKEYSDHSTRVYYAAWRARAVLA